MNAHAAIALFRAIAAEDCEVCAEHPHRTLFRCLDEFTPLRVDEMRHCMECDPSLSCEAPDAIARHLWSLEARIGPHEEAVNAFDAFLADLHTGTEDMSDAECAL
jgi:hypothetical protein